MVKRAFVLVIGFLMMATAGFAAPDRVGKHEIGVNVSANMSTDSDVDSTVFVGGQWAYGVTDWFAFGVESGWSQADSSGTATGSGITVTSDSELTAIPVLADFIFRAPHLHENLVPYAVVGVGAVFWDEDGTTTASAPGFGTFPVEVEVDTAFGLKVGGGFDWFIDQNWIIFFEASYTYTEPDVEVTVLGASSSEETDLSYVNVGGGFKYVF